MVVRGQELLRTFRRLLRTTISCGTTFVAWGMRHGIDAMLPHGIVVRTVRQLFGNLSPRKTTLIFVAAGLIGLALILLLLLEISVRRELAKEASDAAIDATLPEPVVQAPGQALQSPATALPQSSPFQLPTVYGVYAISGDQLHELEALPGRVPDQRVFMSTPIRTPGTVLAGNDPVRAGLVPSESSEMLMIRPENADFVFPAGRYGLVIKGQAYDFTVAGPITEAAQCLEGVKASNGTFYSECRNP
jgi:hypothetical protein